MSSCSAKKVCSGIHWHCLAAWSFQDLYKETKYHASMHQYHVYKFASMLIKQVMWIWQTTSTTCANSKTIPFILNYTRCTTVQQSPTVTENRDWTCTLCICITRKQQDLQHKRCQRRESHRHPGPGGTLTCCMDTEPF